MLKFPTHALFSGFVSLVVVLPALAQQEDSPRQREIDQQMQDQIDLAVQELFQDFELQEGEADELRERFRQAQERREAIRRGAINMQERQGRGLGFEDQVGDLVELDVKPMAKPWADRPRAEIVAALGDASYDVRESAQAHLLADETLDRASLKSLIEQADLPEQQQRLLKVAEHHVLREMRVRNFGNVPEDVDPVRALNRQARSAAVGYSYEPVLAENNPYQRLAGVRVIATMPGFPGHAHFRQGDIIVQIAGQRPAVHHQHHEITQWVRWRISEHQAGDAIEFIVIRAGELISIEVVCAEGLALDHMYTTDAFETAARKEPYDRAWDQARDELIKLMPKPKTLVPTAIDPAE